MPSGYPLDISSVIEEQMERPQDRSGWKLVPSNRNAQTPWAMYLSTAGTLTFSVKRHCCMVASWRPTGLTLVSLLAGSKNATARIRTETKGLAHTALISIIGLLCEF